MVPAAITVRQHEALRLIAGGGVWFDPRVFGVCGARADAVDDLVDAGLVEIDRARDHGSHPRYPRHPVVLTAVGRAVIAIDGVAR